jgi:hypothetical protein
MYRITEQGNGLCRMDKKTGLMLHSLCTSPREAGDCVKSTENVGSMQWLTLQTVRYANSRNVYAVFRVVRRAG